MTAIVVMQMGKVGSRSIVDSLERHLSGPIFHVHALRPESLAAARVRFEADDRALPPHLEHSETVREMLHGGEALKVITLTREPISRNMSAFFQRLSDEGRTPTDDSAPTIETLIAEFKASRRHGVATGWFDNQFKVGLGIDVYDHPFSPHRQYQRYQAGPVQALLIRTEAPDDLKAEQISEFVGEQVDIRRSNDSSTKAYSDAYAAFKGSIVLDARYVNRMLNSRYTQHFYTEKERRRVRHFWRLRRQAAETDGET